MDRGGATHDTRAGSAPFESRREREHPAEGDGAPTRWANGAFGGKSLFYLKPVCRPTDARHMAAGAEAIWLLIAIVLIITVVGCLRVIGFAYYNAVVWHNLKVEVQQLRVEQRRQIAELMDNELAARTDGDAAPAAGSDAIAA